MPKVKVGNINMYYEIHGEGEPLANFSGAGGTAEAPPPLISFLIAQGGYQVILSDYRGAGRSEAPDIPFTFETLADDLADLLNTIGIKAAHIAGSSLGGNVAQHFALRYPEKTITLTLICCGCGGTHKIPSDPDFIRFSSDPAIAKMPAVERSKLAFPFIVNTEFINKHPEMLRQLSQRNEIKYPTSPQIYMRQRQAGNAHDTYDRLPEIKAPTLVVNGEVDRVVPVENARILASRIPNAELVILKNAGHMMIEAGDELNRTVLDFLRRHSTKRA